MNCAPKDCSWVEVELAGGDICQAHWASDLSGEEQPPYRGWFRRNENGVGFAQVYPLHWRPLAKNA